MITATAQTKSQRSPNYPSMSLPEAIAKVTAIYRKEHTYWMDRATAVNHMGYGSVNGASATALSTLIKYGLLEYSKGKEEVRVTDRAFDIAELKPGDPARATAIRQAAFTPPLFAELYNQFRDRLPSDENLRVQLLRRGFIPRAVGDVIRAYRDTMAFVDDEGASPSTDHEDVGEEEEEAPMEMRTLADAAYPKTRLPLTTAALVDDPDTKTLHFPIGNDLQVHTMFKGQVTPQSLNAYIQILRLTLGMPEDAALERLTAHTQTASHLIESEHDDGQEEA
jgi:hypothetical protein